MKPAAPFVFAILAVVLCAPRASAIQEVQTFASVGLGNVSRLRFDSSGNLFATQRGATGRIAKFPAGSSTATTFAASSGNDFSAITIDSQNNVFVADYQLGIVYKFTPSGARSTFMTGLTNPWSLAVDSQDNIYVGELVSQDIFKITPGGSSSLFGNANLQPTGTGSAVRLTALAFDRSGNLYCGTYGNGTGYLGPFSLSYLLPGGGTGIRLPQGGLPTVDFALGPGDLFYTAGYHLDRIGQMNLAGSMITYAGTTIAGLINGPLLTSRFNQPSGIALDPATGYLFIADNLNSVIRVIKDDVSGPTEARRTSWGRLKALYH